MPKRKSDEVTDKMLEDALTLIRADPTKDKKRGTHFASAGCTGRGQRGETEKTEKRMPLSVVTENSTYTNVGRYSGVVFARLKQSH